MNVPACIMQRDVDDHFRGVIEPPREHALRAHLTSCTQCRRRYARRALLAKLDPEAIAPAARLAGGLGLDADGMPDLGRGRASVSAPRGRASPWHQRFLPEAVLVLVAAAALFLVLGSPARDSNNFAPRGSVDPAATVAPVLRVYRIAEGGTPTPVTDTLGRDDELAFAYENPERKPWLAIFAVDEQKHVYWLYPAWTNPSEDPRTIPAETTPGMHELREAVRHHFRGARVDFHALFLDKPLTVRQIEAEIGRPLPGDHVATFTVLP